MSWRALTESDLAAVLSGDELSAIATAALNAGQTDAVADALASVSLSVRSYIAANPANSLEDGDDMVPLNLVHAAAVLAREIVLNRVDLPLSEDRRKETETARKLLEQVAAGKYAIPKPETADPDYEPQELAHVGLTTVDSSDSETRTATRKATNGLI